MKEQHKLKMVIDHEAWKLRPQTIYTSGDILECHRTNRSERVQAPLSRVKYADSIGDPLWYCALMRTPARSLRVNNALQVFQHMNSGMTVSDACREVGIPRCTFYNLVEKNPEAISEVQDIIDANKREQLVMVLLAQTEMLRKIIEDGLSDNIKPRERVAIFQKLDELKNNLMQSQHIDDENERRAHEFLKRGPTLRHVESRF